MSDNLLLRAVTLRHLFPDAQWRLPDSAGTPAVPAGVNPVDEVESGPLDQGRLWHLTRVAETCHPGSIFTLIPAASPAIEAQRLQTALARGAAAIVSNRPLDNLAVPVALVGDPRFAYGRACHRLRGNPTKHLRVMGVTGTNGKTTVTWMLRHLLRRVGYHTGLLGTIEYDDGCHIAPADLTTPDAAVMADWFARMHHQGVTHAAIELSSHALDQHRAAGIALAAAVVTNITQDHFDYHQTFAHYRDSKARIFDHVAPGGLVLINQDDPGAWSLWDRCAAGWPRTTTADCPPIRRQSFGLTPAAESQGQVLEESLRRTWYRITTGGEHQACVSHLVGRYNLSNAIAAAAVAKDFGLSLREIVSGLESFRAPPGRLERIDVGQPFDVYVDFAHTEDALARCLSALRSLTAGRLICVFGAGGDRDATKRPKLGRAALTADIPIVTSDNPRSEEPRSIINQIVDGMQGHPGDVLVEPDRLAAIRLAVRLARTGDCVVIAGKGHETTQIVGGQVFPFDDRQLARNLLRERLLEESGTPQRPAA